VEDTPVVDRYRKRHLLNGHSLRLTHACLTFIDCPISTLSKLLPVSSSVVEGEVEERCAEELKEALASQGWIDKGHLFEELGHNCLIVDVVQMEVEKEEHVLLPIVNGILTAIEVIEGASLGFEE